MTNREEYLHTLTSKSSSKATTQFKYAYLKSVLTDECINDNGSVNEKALYKSLKNHFDKALDYDGGVRYVLRVFPTCCSSSAWYSPILVDDKYTEDGKMYIWYPEKLHKILMESEYPTMSFYKDITVFKDTKNLSIIDFRSDIVYNVYDIVLRCFSQYLNETIDRKDIYGHHLKKGDFISCIEIGYVGPFGEGRTDFYSMYKSSEPLMRIAELYKKYLSDYILIAPGYGMRTDITTNPNLIPFQEYLLKTTYGKNSEFGLFIDHLGHYNYFYDFSLSIPGITNLRELACKKRLKAPFIGENSGNFQRESTSIYGCVKEFGLSMCDPWGDLVLDSAALREWSRAAEIMGYVFSIKNQVVIFDGRKASVSFEINNEGVSFCFWDFWKPEIVLREHNSQNIVSVFDVSKYIELRSKSYPHKIAFKITVIPSLRYFKNEREQYDLYIRVVDKKGISDDMEFSDGRKEVLLGSN